MARLGRYFLPDQPLHAIQRGNNREAIFLDPEDHARYRHWLASGVGLWLRIQGTVLMTNHVRLRLTHLAADSLPRTMQSLGRRYLRYLSRGALHNSDLNLPLDHQRIAQLRIVKAGDRRGNLPISRLNRLACWGYAARQMLAMICRAGHEHTKSQPTA